MSNYVKVHYGPCDSFQNITLKPHKLHGLRDFLRKLGYRVYLVPSDFINYCMLEMCGHEIFRCNINNFKFNTPHDLDPVCRRAVHAVQMASHRLKRARNYFWIWGLIQGILSLSEEYGPRNYWPKDTEIKPLASCRDCVDCCGILVSKK